MHDQTLLLREAIYPVVHLYYSQRHVLQQRNYCFFNMSMEEKMAVLRDIPEFHVSTQGYTRVPCKYSDIYQSSM